MDFKLFQKYESTVIISFWFGKDASSLQGSVSSRPITSHFPEESPFFPKNKPKTPHKQHKKVMKKNAHQPNPGCFFCSPFWAANKMAEPCPGHQVRNFGVTLVVLGFAPNELSKFGVWWLVDQWKNHKRKNRESSEHGWEDEIPRFEAVDYLVASAHSKNIFVDWEVVFPKRGWL